MNKKRGTIIAVICVIALTATFLLLPGNGIDILDSLPIHEPGTPRYNYAGGSTLTGITEQEVVYNNITGDYRPKYVEMTDDDYGWIFEELPEFKKDFFAIAQLIYEGKITDYSRVSSNYWKQPEFYVGWYSSIEKYTNNDPETWIPEGYGCYPIIKEGTASAGSHIVVSTYFKTGFATEAYQGLIVRPYLPSNAKSILDDIIFEQPANADQYLSVAILNEDNAIYNSFKDDIESNNVGVRDWFIIMEPTYQVLEDKYGNVQSRKGFPSDWVRLLNISIDIASDTPPGDYVVAIKPITPCYAINQEFYFSTEHEYYGSYYNPAGRIYQTNTPHFQFILHVE